jgi:hypothetical protein
MPSSPSIGAAGSPAPCTRRCAPNTGDLIEHGGRWPDGEKWWAGYCAARGLDPDDPRS